MPSDVLCAELVQINTRHKLIVKFNEVYNETTGYTSRELLRDKTDKLFWETHIHNELLIEPPREVKINIARPRIRNNEAKQAEKIKQ